MIGLITKLLLVEKLYTSDDSHEFSILSALGAVFTYFSAYLDKVKKRYEILLNKVEGDSQRGINVLDHISNEIEKYDNQLNNDFDDFIVYRLGNQKSQFKNLIDEITFKIIDIHNFEGKIRYSESDTNQISLKIEEISALGKLRKYTQYFEGEGSSISQQMTLGGFFRVDREQIEKVTSTIEYIQLAFQYTSITGSGIKIKELKHLESAIIKIIEYCIKIHLDHIYKLHLIFLHEKKKNNEVVQNNFDVSAIQVDEVERNYSNIKLTMAQKVLMMHYLFSGHDIPERKEKTKARFIQVLCGINSFDNLYKSVLNPFVTEDKNFRRDDLKAILPYFESLGLENIVEQIRKEKRC